MVMNLEGKWIKWMKFNFFSGISRLQHTTVKADAQRAAVRSWSWWCSNSVGWFYQCIIRGYQSAKINDSTRMVYNTKRRTCRWHSPLDFSEAGDAKKMCCFVGEFGSLSLVMTQDEALHRAPEKLKICYLFSILGIEFNIFNPVAAFTRFVETRLMAAVCLARCGQLPMIAFKTKASVANGIATAFLPSWRLPMTGPQAAKDS